MSKDCKGLGSADIFEMTCYMSQQLGWDKVSAAIFPKDSPCQIA